MVLAALTFAKSVYLFLENVPFPRQIDLSRNVQKDGLDWFPDLFNSSIEATTNFHLVAVYIEYFAINNILSFLTGRLTPITIKNKC